MHQCEADDLAFGECYEEATKCIRVKDSAWDDPEDVYYWLCDHHYSDPDVRQVLEESYEQVDY
jgi:hypothetical protein